MIISLYDEVLTVAMKGSTIQWEMGDALVRAVGMGPGQQGGTGDGSQAILEDISKVLNKQGFDYSVGYLAQLRTASLIFQQESRDYCLSWSIHRIAGSPQMLEMIKTRAASDKQKLTKEVASDLKKKIMAAMPTSGAVIAKAVAISAEFSRIKNEGIMWEKNKVLEEPMVVEKLLEAIKSLQELLTSLGNPRSHIRAIGE